ncbi:DoxX family protein [Hymenobacter sp.]|uniref:DoxX family protein n=1 Tax=Hymenobacter sp. TaxID=1898978 RepID=UPI00286CC611|nr:DoxX family protein [Hymenobacter sp.]
MATAWLGKTRPETATLLLRLFLGAVLIYGTQDNVFHHGRMVEFRDFLAQHHFPYPMLSAHLSAWAQFGCGWLLVAGVATRAAALVVVGNFLVALVMVHQGLPFNQNIAPLAMLIGGVYFLLHGPGRYSLAEYLARRSTQVPPVDRL